MRERRLVLGRAARRGELKSPSMISSFRIAYLEAAAGAETAARYQSREDEATCASVQSVYSLSPCHAL